MPFGSAEKIGNFYGKQSLHKTAAFTLELYGDLDSSHAALSRTTQHDMSAL
jgi:hypothetical protein